EELEHDDAHLFIAAATEPSHHAEPVVIFEFVLRHALDHVQQRLGDEAFELAEGLPFRGCADVFLLLGMTLAQDQLADFVKPAGAGSQTVHPQSPSSARVIGINPSSTLTPAENQSKARKCT